MIRILLADDEPDVRESTAMLLAASGYDVTSVGKSTDILPTLRRVRPDILLQDVYMPGLDIDRLVADVRADAALKDVRIVVFTASVEAEEIRHRVQADGVLRKPFDAERIHALLDRYVEGTA